MRGKGHKRAAEKAFKQWQRLHFDTLFDSRAMPTPVHATLRLPVVAAGAPSLSTATASSIDLHLSTNHRGVTEWWESEYGSFLGADQTPRMAASAANATAVIASSQVAAHVGPPAGGLGYPTYIAEEAKQWTEGVLRGETYAYEHADGPSGWTAPPPEPNGAPYLTPIRWLRQPLLDGFVAQRLTAHAGVTTPALLDARRAAAALGQLLPPFDLSPFYAASELLDRWCLFGTPTSLVPAPSAAAGSATMAATSAVDDAAAHHRRAADLALAAAVLPNFHATWMNGAVVRDASTGRSVLIVGPRASGKTTVALHCVSPSAHERGEAVSASSEDAQLRLTAAEHFFLGAGTPVTRMIGAPLTATATPSVFVCAVPHRVEVGMGAVLGTLRPNPALTAVTALPPFLSTDAGVRAFLANPDGVIWKMSMHYHVRLQDVCGGPSWQPASVSALAGVVLLDWDVDELAATSAAPARTRVRRIPLHAGGLEELLTRGRDYLFRGHYLVRSVYDDANEGPARLSKLLEEEWAVHPPANTSAAALHCIEGSVNFDVATKLVKELLAT